MKSKCTSWIGTLIVLMMLLMSSGVAPALADTQPSSRVTGSLASQVTRGVASIPALTSTDSLSCDGAFSDLPCHPAKQPLHRESYN